MSAKKTSQIQKDQSPKKNLIKGATSILKGFETPVILLEFLTQSLYWMDLYNKKNKGNTMDSYFLKTIIGEIAIPWLKNDANAQKLIARGLEDLHDIYGCEEYHKYLSAITQGFTIYLEDQICYDLKRKYFLMLATMFEVGDCIACYEMELFYIRREEDKAA